MWLKNSLFISKQLILIGREKYDCVQNNCYRFKEKYGDCFAYHYVILYLGYYTKDYDMSYSSFYWLVKNNKAKRKLIDWGISLFIEKIIAFEKRYETARKRIDELSSLEGLNSGQIQKLKNILTYLNTKLY